MRKLSRKRRLKRTTKVRKKTTNANNAASRKLKKEENDADDDDKPIGTSFSGSRAKVVKKKEEIDDIDEKKPISKRNSSAGVSKVRKETEKEEVKKKREKKVYDLPGQKRDQPEEVVLLLSFSDFLDFLANWSENFLSDFAILQREPLRIFYESLYKQIPTSEMAQICNPKTLKHMLVGVGTKPKIPLSRLWAEQVNKWVEQINDGPSRSKIGSEEYDESGSVKGKGGKSGKGPVDKRKEEERKRPRISGL